MIDMPTAVVILGVLGTVTVAIIKLPRRRSNNGNNGAGRRMVSEQMCEERSGAIKLAIVDLKHSVDKVEETSQAILVKLAEGSKS